MDYGHGEAAEKFGEDPRSFGVMTEEIMKDALQKAHSARKHILTEMQKVVKKPRISIHKIPKIKYLSGMTHPS